jgi:DNA modification methylase
MSRKPNAIPGGGAMPLDRAKDKKKHVSGALGKSFPTIHPYDKGGEGGEVSQSGTSIFDPVLCEIAYRWFSPEGCTILDPFAGGSVRGIVAAKLNRQYIGHELRPEQVEANKFQGDELCHDDQYPPVWICGDSRNIDKTCHDVSADMVFSCPPYADLEVYSDDPQDLSTLAYSDFIAAYRDIIKKSCDRLKDNSFACFVVGEVRDKKGNYYNFVGDTIAAFVDAGLNYYNEMILVTACGSLPIRAGKQFTSSRKIGKTHQNILVFVKGDGKKAADKCGIIEIDESLFISDDECGDA